MKYQIEYTPQAVEDLKGLPPTTRSLLYGWIEKNLVDCEDPRRHGSGDPEGGRWRYQIGDYRILAQIQENRIVILTVLTGLRRTAIRKNSGNTKPTLSSNVFLRSTLRQPVKTALLLVVLALITFAFVSRAAEYLLVRQETERLGSYYRAVGTLTSGWQDTSEAAAYLEARKDVDVVNVYRYVSGVLGDFCNADTKLDDPNNFNRFMIFYGILNAWDNWTFHFTVDEVVSGYPEYIEEGRMINARLVSISGELTPDDLDGAYARLEKGERYLYSRAITFADSKK